MDPAAISLVYGARVAQAWVVNVMVDETTELILKRYSAVATSLGSCMPLALI